MLDWSAVSLLERVPELRTAVVRHTVRDVVADKIATLIASGMLQVGDVLPSERDLAAALQVSRVTVRGGHQILSARGIIEVSHGVRQPRRLDRCRPGQDRAARAAPDQQLRHRGGARGAPPGRARRSSPTRPRASTRPSSLSCARPPGGAGRRRSTILSRFLISDREFHLAIYQACGNPVLADFVSDLYAYFMEHRRKAVSRPGAILRSVRDHEAILAALEARDPARVVARLRGPYRPHLPDNPIDHRRGGQEPAAIPDESVVTRTHARAGTKKPAARWAAIGGNDEET